MSKSNVFAQDLNRAAREPIGGLSIKQIRQQVIDYLQGKRTVSVDYRRIRADQRGSEDDEPTGKEKLEIVDVMKYFTVVKRHGSKTCIQDMYPASGHVLYCRNRRDRMFIDCAKLEKILKADYKSWGVKFGLTEKGMYILNGTGWMIEADKEKITKEFLGTIIKTCGLAPEKGEFMTYQKGHDPQFETERKPLLWDMAGNTKEAFISQIKIMQRDNMMSVVKTPGGARLINDARLAIVNPDKCRKDEDPPSTFAVHDDWLISHNDEMAVGICFTEPLYKPELEVLRLLSGVDFYWIETPHYEL